MKITRNLFLQLLCGTVFAGGLSATQASRTPTAQDTYLTEFEHYLQDFPRDGRFGSERLPEIHGKAELPEDALVVKAFKEIALDNYAAGMTFGQFNKQSLRFSTMGSHYRIDDIPYQSYADGLRLAVEAETKFLDLDLQAAARQHIKKGKLESKTTLQLGKLKAMVRFRSVNAKDKACLTCHAEIQLGKPIGVIALVTIPRASVPPEKNQEPVQ